MTTIVDVARLAGVGTTTVTKVVGKQPHVRDSTRRRVLEAIAALDYHPSAAGRILRTGVTHVIGVITPPPATHPFAYTFFANVLEGIGECGAEHDYDILWITADSFGAADRRYDSLFKSKRVDGLIDVSIYVRDPRIEMLRASGHPFVLIGHPEDASIPHVDAANRDAGLTVGRAFLVRGYTSAAYLGVVDSPASLDRLAGLQRAFAEAGRAMHPAHLALLERERDVLGLEPFGHASMHRWIEDRHVPRAVLTSTDQLAYGVMRACQEKGLRVPEDVAVVGFDNEPTSSLLQPPLASVEQPIRQLGYEAAALLLRLLAGEAPDSPTRVLPTRLIERASLGPVPHVDPGLPHGLTATRTTPGLTL